MITLNKRVACTPFITTQTRIEVRGGLPQIKQRKELTPLTVVYDAEGGEAFREYRVGETVYVRGECCKHAWASEVFEVEEGKPFVLVPFEFVVGKIEAD